MALKNRRKATSDFFRKDREAGTIVLGEAPTENPASETATTIGAANATQDGEHVAEPSAATAPANVEAPAPQHAADARAEAGTSIENPHDGQRRPEHVAAHALQGEERQPATALDTDERGAGSAYDTDESATAGSGLPAPRSDLPAVTPRRRSAYAPERAARRAARSQRVDVERPEGREATVSQSAYVAPEIYRDWVKALRRFEDEPELGEKKLDNSSVLQAALEDLVASCTDRTPPADIRDQLWETRRYQKREIGYALTADFHADLQMLAFELSRRRPAGAPVLKVTHLAEIALERFLPRMLAARVDQRLVQRLREPRRTAE
jgi:hypothetical protein